MKNILLQIFILIIFISCNSNNKESSFLPGKIIYTTDNYKPKTQQYMTELIFSDNSKLKKLNIPFDECELYYENFIWFNKSDYLVATQTKLSKFNAGTNPDQVVYHDKNGKIKLSLGTKQSIILSINLYGRIIDTIYKPKENEILIQYLTSPNDSLLLFSSTLSKSQNKNDTSSNYFDNHSSIVIIELKNKNIIPLLVFNKNESISFEENSWSPLGEKIIFTYYQRTSCFQDKNKIPKKYTFPKEGVYVYDLKSKKTNLLIEEACNAIWSKDGKYIAFLKNNNVYTLNLNQNKIELIERENKYKRGFDIHWAGNQNKLYIDYYVDYFNDCLDIFMISTGTTKLEIVDIESKSVEYVKGIYIGPSYNYTWK